MTLTETLRYSMEDETTLSVPVTLDEPLTLQKALSLSGEGEAVAYNTERATLHLTGEGPYCFRGLHFQHHYQQAVTLIQVTDALVIFQNCTFSGACGGEEENLAAAVDIRGQSRVYFEGCQFHHNDRHIVATGRANVSLRNCTMQEARADGLSLSGHVVFSAVELEIANSGWSGVTIDDSAHLQLSDSQLVENGCHGLEALAMTCYQGARNLFGDNGQNGVTATGSCRLLSDSDQFLSNGFCGLDLGEESSASVRWGHAAQNKSHGIQGRNSSRLDLADSMTCENQGSGVALFEKASLNGEDLQSEQNRLTGFQATGDARVTLSRTSIGHNGACGAAVYQKGRLNIERSRICDCTGYGVQLSDDCHSLIRDCEITENSRGGILMTGRASGLLEVATLAHNGRDGVAVRGEARLTATENRLHDNGRDGIYVESTGRCALLGNRSEKNLRHGIYLAIGSTPLLADNRCEDNDEKSVCRQEDEVNPMLDLESGEFELPFQPEGVERTMLDALARHGRLSELALGKVANTRRVGGAMENLIDRLNRAGTPIIQRDGQGPEGVVYALKVDTSRKRVFGSEETIETQIVF
jgi:parallel beta-helix repeat protein